MTALDTVMIQDTPVVTVDTKLNEYPNVSLDIFTLIPYSFEDSTALIKEVLFVLGKNIFH